MSATENGPNYVRINRLKEGWTYNVQVSADNNSTEALKAANARALMIIRELNDELTPVVVEEEIPY